MSDEGKFFGLYRGIVRSNDDSHEANGYRCCLKVYVPQVYGQEIETVDLPWAEPCLPFGGGRLDQEKSYGFIAIPPIGASVWVMFEQGYNERPVWMGAWYGTRDGDPELPEEAQDEYPNTILFKDPTDVDGMYFRMTRGEKIELVAKTGAIRLTLFRDGDIEVRTPSGDVSIESVAANVTVKSTNGRVRLETGEVVVTELENEDLVEADVRQWILLDPTPTVIDPETGLIITHPRLIIRGGDIYIQAANNLRQGAAETASNSSKHAGGYEAH